MPDHRHQPVLQGIHNLGKFGDSQAFTHPRLINLMRFKPESNRLQHRRIGNEDILRHIPDALKPCGQILLDRHPIAQNAPLLGAEKPQNQINQGGLSRTRAAHEGHRRPHRDLQVNVLQHRLITVGVGKGKVLHRNSDGLNLTVYVLCLNIRVGSRRKIELLPLFIKHPNFADKLIAGFLTGTNIT